MAGDRVPGQESTKLHPIVAGLVEGVNLNRNNEIEAKIQNLKMRQSLPTTTDTEHYFDQAIEFLRSHIK